MQVESSFSGIFYTVNVYVCVSLFVVIFTEVNKVYFCYMVFVVFNKRISLTSRASLRF